MPDGRKGRIGLAVYAPWWDSDDVHIATSVLEDLVDQIGVKGAGH
jgi:hypothetical protein